MRNPELWIGTVVLGVTLIVSKSMRKTVVFLTGQILLYPLAVAAGILCGLFGVGSPRDCVHADPDRETYQ